MQGACRVQPSMKIRARRPAASTETRAWGPHRGIQETQQAFKENEPKRHAEAASTKTRARHAPFSSRRILLALMKSRHSRNPAGIQETQEAFKKPKRHLLPW